MVGFNNKNSVEIRKNNNCPKKASPLFEMEKMLYTLLLFVHPLFLHPFNFLNP